MEYPASKIFVKTWLDTLKPDTKIHRIRDIQTPGLNIFVRPSGVIGWVYRYTYLNDKGKKAHTFYTFGKYSNKGTGKKLTLAEARDKCNNELMSLAEKGINLKTYFKNNLPVVASKNTLNEMFREAFKVRTSFYPEDFNPEVLDYRKHPQGFKKSYEQKVATSRDYVSYTNANDMKSRVTKYVLPKLSERNVLEIKPFELDEIIASIQPKVKKDKDGIKFTCPMLDTRRKLFSDMKTIFKYARSHFPELIYIPTDAVDMKQHLKDFHIEKTHMVTTTDFEGIQEIMWKLATHLATSTRMSWQVRIASLLLPLTHLRPGELVALRWTEIDFKKGLINIPGSYKAHTDKPEKRMKMSRDHVVPMSSQLKDLLQHTQEYSKSQGIVSRYVFPKIIARKNMILDQDGKCHIDETITIEALEDTLKRAGISSKTELTPHGWRAMASTSLNGGLILKGEKKRFESKWIEVALSHHSIKKEDGGAMAEVYNHAKYLPERIEMAQDWADYLESFMLTNPSLKSLHQPSLALLVQPKQTLYRIT